MCLALYYWQCTCRWQIYKDWRLEHGERYGRRCSRERAPAGDGGDNDGYNDHDDSSGSNGDDRRCWADDQVRLQQRRRRPSSYCLTKLSTADWTGLCLPYSKYHTVFEEESLSFVYVFEHLRILKDI